MQKGKLIGIVGFKGSGKTTITAAAIDKLTGFHQIKFSTPIANMLLALGVPERFIYEKKFWDIPIAELGEKTVRHAFQTLGTEWGRNLITENLWTEITVRKVEELRNAGGHVIVEDVRFPSEFDRLAELGATFIGIERKGLVSNDSHTSESHISSLLMKCGDIIHNDGTFSEAVFKMCLKLDKKSVL